MALKALIYTRVSEDRAAGRSVAEQEADARKECDRNGWTVFKVVTDSVGASRHSRGARTGWEEAKALVGSGSVDVLVTWEASRAQRDVKAYLELRTLCAREGVRWSYSGRLYDLSDSDDRFTTGLDALLAEREADQIAKRVQRAIRANADSGRPHGRILDGYARVYDDRTGAYVRQELDPERAPVIGAIFERYLSGEGIRTIARAFNEEGVSTHTGKLWTYSQVRSVLGNPGYAARRVHQGNVIGDGDWPPIVPGDVFDRVQARLAASAQKGVRNSSRSRLLTGVGRCGVCGGKVHALHDRRGRKLYGCRERFCVARDMTKLDDFVSALVLRFLERPDVVEALAGSREASPEVVRAQRERVDLEARLQSAIDEFSAGKLSSSTLARIEAQMLPEMKECEDLIRRAMVPVQVVVPAEHIEEWWDSLLPEQQREVVGALLAAVVILPTGKGKRRLDPDHIRVEWRGAS